MTRVLMWKELREQAMAAVALLVLGAGVLISLAVWRPPADPVGMSEGDMMAPLVLAWLCGLVAGAQTLAGEYQNGTMSWLDALPTSRRRIWNDKTLAALTVLGLQTLLLIVFAASLGYYRKLHFQWATDPLTVAIPLAVLPLTGMAFGLFGSAVGRTPMAAIGWALLGHFVAGIAFALMLSMQRSPIGMRIVSWLAPVMLPSVPAIISYRVYTRLDRRRRSPGMGPVAAVSSARALLWLTWRQVRWLQITILIAGLFIASILPRTEPLAWLLFGTAFGAVLGVSVFAPDQLGGAVRFLGERWLPWGRLWLVKTAVALAPMIVIILVFLLNVWLNATARAATREDVAVVWERLGYDRVVTPSVILLGPIYGFAVGQFFGLISRKGAVAAVLTLLTAGGLLIVWLPSMVIGGLHVWQWLAPPVVLIATSWLLMRPWVSGRLSDWRPAAGIVAAGLLAVGGVAFGLWWRVIEFPAIGEPFERAAFYRNSSPHESGQKMQLAGQQFLAFHEGLRKQAGSLAPPLARFPAGAFAAYMTGSPPPDTDLNAWMDRLFAGEWLRTLREAAALPAGAIPNDPTGSTDQAYWLMLRLLCARGLQLQERGEQREALASFRLAFDTERRMSRRDSTWEAAVNMSSEREMLQALVLWVGNTDQPALLRDALGMLRENELALPPLTETVEVGYELARSLHNLYSFGPDAGYTGGEVHGILWFAPWEEERTRRIIDWLFAGWKRTASLSYRNAIEWADPVEPFPYPMLQAWLPPDPTANVQAERDKIRRALSVQCISMPYWVRDELFSQVPWTLTCWRAARLQIALRLYEHEHGHPAERLADLRPAILPELPLDPFNGEQFHYRVAKAEPVADEGPAVANLPGVPGVQIPGEQHEKRVEGERVNMSPALAGEGKVVIVEPGRGIIWSVSTDLVDNGGVRNGGNFAGFSRAPPGFDLIFLVPRPTKR